MKNQKIYDTYWYFAAERQNIFFNKFLGKKPPYSQDPIFQQYKFCNAYRAADRVSQYLIKSVIYCDKFNELDLAFRILFFRLFNKISTWQKIEEHFGQIRLNNFDFEKYSNFLDSLHKNEPIYGNAYILCANKAYGFDHKHQNHLALLKYIFKESKTGYHLLNSKSLKELFAGLKALPLFGDFMAYQSAIDLNYSTLFNFSENDFTIAGPGARRGIRKCFGDTRRSDQCIIQFMVENQQKEFSRLNVKFQDLFGRPLHAIDCQNLFCEVDKYCRVKFPKIKSNRSRIKTTYRENKSEINYFFPPKWNINANIKPETISKPSPLEE